MFNIIKYINPKASGEVIMLLFKKLNNELCEETDGVFAPYYYRFLGYSQDFFANAIVFSITQGYITLQKGN